ncbi:MAG: hypothetical protein LC620_07210, partial [Halobacteriales archaeon]|nr:hypothetical protein [Halobacteriales archaeon]
MRATAANGFLQSDDGGDWLAEPSCKARARSRAGEMHLELSRWYAHRLHDVGAGFPVAEVRERSGVFTDPTLVNAVHHHVEPM